MNGYEQANERMNNMKLHDTTKNLRKHCMNEFKYPHAVFKKQKVTLNKSKRVGPDLTSTSYS